MMIGGGFGTGRCVRLARRRDGWGGRVRTDYTCIGGGKLSIVSRWGRWSLRRRLDRCLRVYRAGASRLGCLNESIFGRLCSWTPRRQGIKDWSRMQNGNRIGHRLDRRPWLSLQFWGEELGLAWSSDLGLQCKLDFFSRGCLCTRLRTTAFRRLSNSFCWPRWNPRGGRWGRWERHLASYHALFSAVWTEREVDWSRLRPWEWARISDHRPLGQVQIPSSQAFGLQLVTSSKSLKGSRQTDVSLYEWGPELFWTAKR